MTNAAQAAELAGSTNMPESCTRLICASRISFSVTWVHQPSYCFRYCTAMRPLAGMSTDMESARVVASMLLNTPFSNAVLMALDFSLWEQTICGILEISPACRRS